MKIFENNVQTTFAVPWNSPLKPIFLKAVLQLKEFGTLEYFSMVWEGKDIVSSGGSELVSLSIGQVVLALMIFSSYFGFALLVLGFELIHSKLMKKTSKTDLDKKRGPFRSQMIQLDNEYTKSQYEIAEEHFENPKQPICGSTLKALEFVQLIEASRKLSGDHEKNPWIYHNKIMTFGIKAHGNDNFDANLMNTETQKDDPTDEIVDLESIDLEISK